MTLEDLVAKIREYSDKWNGPTAAPPPPYSGLQDVGQPQPPPQPAPQPGPVNVPGSGAGNNAGKIARLRDAYNEYVAGGGSMQFDEWLQKNYGMSSNPYQPSP